MFNMDNCIPVSSIGGKKPYEYYTPVDKKFEEERRIARNEYALHMSTEEKTAQLALETKAKAWEDSLPVARPGEEMPRGIWYKVEAISTKDSKPSSLANLSWVNEERLDHPATWL